MGNLGGHRDRCSCWLKATLERALKEHLKTFLDAQAVLKKRPPIRLVTRGRIEIKAARLRKQVELELDNREVTAVIGLVDVTTVQ